ncbi:sensor histidine kinase [Streptomyces flavofungini]|uniref:histidine kinase n=1 Tax=Streptomyces flavofungini TaxID=68200 RepID=A0ABS0WZ24_9ACTN|nr:histidine kinase [Streptomyces flavofungini]MBJ3806187.1 two-component sensor histidine kinase [Streptomyces flavofungini]GHC46816.1 two-component sensor histidine kinase [Streptomyces flavofungini]
MPLPLPRRPDVVDVRICVASLLSGLGLWALGITMQTRPFGESWSLLPLFAMAGLVLLRRTAPTFALCAGSLALIADQFTTGNLATVVMFTDIVYAAVVYGTPAQARRIPVTTGLITVAVTVGFLAWFRQADAILVGAVTALVTFAPATTGVLVRNHREAADLARLRAEQTALLAEMDRTQAVTAERARMARELHDMVANHLSAIAIHSTAALSLDDPRTTKDALTVIRENSVEGLAEMRRLIGILRDSSGDLEPAAAPTLDGLGALAENARTNGLDVRLDDARTPHDPPLPAPVELAAYRIVQESLTNALKHAAPGLVTVALAREPDGLRVRVSSPFGEARGPRAPGSGAGLVGMQERAALLGGTFESGPEPHPELPGAKVWRVEARLPIDPKDQGVTE